MTRKLKHHEQKLLRKVDFITWKQDNDHRDAAVRRRYMIQKPEGEQRDTPVFFFLPYYAIYTGNAAADIVELF